MHNSNSRTCNSDVVVIIIEGIGVLPHYFVRIAFFPPYLYWFRLFSVVTYLYFLGVAFVFVWPYETQLCSSACMLINTH